MKQMYKNVTIFKDLKKHIKDPYKRPTRLIGDLKGVKKKKRFTVFFLTFLFLDQTL